MADELMGEVLLARQPILDAVLDVVGYELLYRDGGADSPSGERANRATATVLLDGVLGLGRAMVADGELIYVNVPCDLLAAGTLLELPIDSIVLELPPDALDTTELREAVAEHRRSGFRVVLDDAYPGDPRLTLVDAVDGVKVDLIRSGVGPGLRLISELAGTGTCVIAERVEDPAHFDRVVGAGAQLVQGFFFTRPRTVRGVRPLHLSAEHLGLLHALAGDEVDLGEVERLIRRDLTLTERFLRLVDVAAGWRRVDSVRDGLVMLGQRSVHRWVTLLVMSTIAPGAPQELVTTASVRARYCEEVAARLGWARSLEAFSLGMFSVLGPDGLLDRETLATLPVSDAVRGALGGHGELRPVLDLQLAAERGDWVSVVGVGDELGLDARQVAEAQVAALRWADEIRGAGQAGQDQASPDSERVASGLAGRGSRRGPVAAS